MASNKKLFQRAQKVIPGGVNSPVRAFKSVNLDPLFISSAKGCTIQDAEGNTFIDFVGSWGPMIVGHANEEVLEAICETASRGTSFGAPTAIEIDLAEKIIAMVPSVEMVRMVNSGTEATMSAIRLARGFTQREHIIKFEGCYHGHGDSFLIKAGSGALTMGEPDSLGVPRSVAQNTLTARFNDISSVQALFEHNVGQVAAVIVEPIAGNMGVVPPADGFLKGLRDLCTQHGSLLIFDEVMTGFRVHPGCAQTLYGVMPDLTTMGKVIGGGLPAAAYGGKKEIMAHVAPTGPVYQAGTLSGNPLAVAAGLKTLEIISRPGFFESLNQKAVTFFENANTYLKEKQLPLSINYVNSMGCLFFKQGGVKNFKEAFLSDTKRFARYFEEMLLQGIYLAPSQFEAAFISSAHSQDDLDLAFDKMKKALEKILR
jgi:glutamate-1-semialdehyde 2,1-aminomutase